MNSDRIMECKNMGTCHKLIAYFNGDNRFMGCCEDCDDFEPDEEAE